MPVEIVETRLRVNLLALKAEMTATLADRVASGPNYARPTNRVTVWLVDDATPEEQQQCRDLIAAHDPDQLTPEQVTIDQERVDLTTFLDDIAAARTQVQNARANWDTWTLAQKDTYFKYELNVTDRMLRAWAFVIRQLVR